MTVELLDTTKVVFEGRVFYRDTLDDEIGQMLRRICRLHHRNKEWSMLKQRVIEAMRKSDYVFFTKYGHHYPNTFVGESYLHKVSLRSTGNLKLFRGRWARIACIGSGARWNREVAAGLIDPVSASLLELRGN